MWDIVFTGVISIGSYKLIEVFQQKLATIIMERAGVESCRYLDQVRAIIFRKMLCVVVFASLPVCAALMHYLYDFSLLSFGFMSLFLAVATYTTVLRIDDKYVSGAFRPKSFSANGKTFVSMKIKGKLTEEEKTAIIEGKNIHSSLFKRS